jgi:hypothetical protein
MSRQAFDSGYIQADETTIKYLKPGSGQAQQGYLWTINAPMIGNTIYHWRNGRGAKHLKEIVPYHFQGTVQCDGYSAYPNLKNDRDERIDLCSCLAHIRRKFHEALEQGQDRSFNSWIFRQIQALYRIEKKLRNDKASPKLRLVARTSQSKYIFNRLVKALRIKFKKNDVLPKSLTGKAISYALNQIELLSVWLADGRVEIDNNLVENKIRPTKLGAKNWLFVGSDNAGWRTATIYSIITSCRNHGVEPYAYLVDVLKRLPSMKISEIQQVLPSNWKPLATCS